MIVRMILFL